VSLPIGIRVEGVTKHYRTGSGLVRAVDGIDLEVEPASSVAITGRSGCGKSTLLGLVGGLDTPTSGSIRLGDQEISRLPERERVRVRRERIGFLFQSDDLLPFLTAAENVCFQLALGGEPDSGDGGSDLLTELGLGEHADKLPDQLSGGQRQRVGIARALVHRPGLILADEPTGELDMASSEAVIDLLLAVRQEIGATLVVVTHDLAVARRMDRTLRLRDGRLAGDGDEPGQEGRASREEKEGQRC
jgi:putative ABC transport system ATP-binding protein